MSAACGLAEGSVEVEQLAHGGYKIIGKGVRFGADFSLAATAEKDATGKTITQQLAIDSHLNDGRMVIGVLDIDIAFKLGVGRLVATGLVTDQKIRTPDDVFAFELWLVDDGDAVALSVPSYAPGIRR